MQAEEDEGTGVVKTPACVICGNRAVWVQNGKGICRECVNQAQAQGAKAVEVTEPSAEALKAAKAIAQMRHPPLSIDLVVLIARDIDRFAQQAVEAERARIIKELEWRETIANKHGSSLGWFLADAIVVVRGEG